jgi:hypothetical protein
MVYKNRHCVEIVVSHFISIIHGDIIEQRHCCIGKTICEIAIRPQIEVPLFSVFQRVQSPLQTQTPGQLFNHTGLSISI